MTCLPLPSLFVCYVHLTGVISMSRKQGLLWLKREPLQSLALHFGSNQLPPLTRSSLFTFSQGCFPVWVSHTGSTSDGSRTKWHWQKGMDKMVPIKSSINLPIPLPLTILFFHQFCFHFISFRFQAGSSVCLSLICYFWLLNKYWIHLNYNLF